MATFIGSAFATWRKERDRVRSLEALIDSLDVPDFGSSLIAYEWIGQDKGIPAAFIHVALINTGADSRVSGWDVELDLPGGKRGAEIGHHLPTELYSRALQARTIKHVSLFQGYVRRPGVLNGYLWATFEGVDPERVTAESIRVLFRDSVHKEYELKARGRVLDRVRRERGSAKPLENDPVVERWLKAAQEGPLPNWRRQ